MKKAFFCILCLAALGTFVLSSCEPEIDDNNTQTTPTTPDTPNTPTDTVVCGETVGEWVDLGLPSGLLWYSVNIGATSPEEYGCYFAWGETQAKEVYSWDTYTYGDYDSVTRTYTIYKYNTQERPGCVRGTVDNKTVLEASDDVATAVLGAGARIPTYDDWVELRNNTTGEWTEQNGVNGWKFTATNGNSLFLPAAGYRYGSSLHYAGTFGDYLSSSLYSGLPYYAYFFGFLSGGSYMDNCADRYCGWSVRAVRASQN